MSLMRISKHLDQARSDAKRALEVAGSAVEQTQKVYGLRLLRAGLLWGSTYVLSRGLLELLPGTDRTVRVLIAVAPLPLFVWFLWIWMKGLGAMDELQRRIELEALAFAFPICVVLLMTLGLLELAIPLNPDDWSYRHVWAMMPALYFAGLWRAKRRYE
jgi:hypothetical protein